MSKSVRGSIKYAWQRGDTELLVVIYYQLHPLIPQTYWQPAEGGDCELWSDSCLFDAELEANKELWQEIDELCRDDAAERCEEYEP
jgi:hypothetical protein